jgi:hypothetical protein
MWLSVSVFILFVLYGAQSTAEKEDVFREILLFGDSLVSRTETNYWFSNDILRLVERSPLTQDFDVQIRTAGHGGDTVADLQNRVYSDVLFRRDHDGVKLPAPHAVIVFWDSDASDDTDLDRFIADRDYRQTKQDRHYVRLKKLLHDLKQSVRFIAVAGPGLIGG